MLGDRNGRWANSSEGSALPKNTAKVDRCRARRHRLVKGFKDLRAHLVARPADGRPQMDMEVLRATPETCV